MRSWSPRPYQTLALEFILQRDRCALWAGMGMGKTSTSLAVCDCLYNLHGETRPTLVIAPLRVARTTWPDEVGKWTQFSTLDIVPVVGDLKERTAAMKRDAPIFTINYEQIPWLMDHLGDAWPFGMVIADEATRLKNTRIARKVHPKSGKVFWQHAGGTRSRALGRKTHRTPRFLELTGTPSPNGLIDLWGQMWHLDMGKALGYSFEAFTRRWYSKTVLPGTVVYEPHDHAQAEIQALLGDLCLTLDPKDWFDLQEPIHNTIFVDLPKRARQAYRDMEREMFALIAGMHEVEAVNAASKTMKCLQLANGAAYIDDAGTFEVVHDEKLDALESIVEEASGAPVLCAYHFKSDRARILKRFPDAIDIALPEGEKAAKAGKGKLWIGHPASIGHGIDGLQEHCNIVAFFGMWWDAEQRAQFIERVGPVRQAQAGKERPVWIHDIVARGTVDELVQARHATKRGVQDLLLEAMKRGTTA